MIDHEALPAEFREAAKRIMLERVNQAREALVQPPLEELERCQPNHCEDCVLGHHLEIGRVDQVEGYITTIHLNLKHPLDAQLVAEAWGTSVWHGPSTYDVTLPRDLQVATAAFDAGQIPELIGGEASDYEDLGDPVSPEEIEAVVES